MIGGCAVETGDIDVGEIRAIRNTERVQGEVAARRTLGDCGIPDERGDVGHVDTRSC